MVAEKPFQIEKLWGLRVWVRRILRQYSLGNGQVKSKYYYYWYKSKRIGKKVISESFGPASEKDYLHQLKKRNEELF